jgi:hypothetical protein
MDEINPTVGAGVKIEQPERPEKVGFFYGFLLLLSFALIGFTVWLLVMEWLGTPLPAVLRVPVGL